MRRTDRAAPRRLAALLIVPCWVSCWALAALSQAGCVRLIAPFDEQTRNEILADARSVDRFYGELLETDPGKRSYAASSQRYVQIETDLRALVLRNQARPLNEDSTRIARDILTLWQRSKDFHQKHNGYPDGSARLDRESFGRLFLYALTAEQAKAPEPSAPDGGDGSRPVRPEAPDGGRRP